VVGEDERVVVVRRILAPPAPPCVVRPISPDGSEHVAAHDRRTQAHLARGRKAIINAIVAALFTEHLSEGSGAERPVVELHSAYSKGIVEALVRPCRVSVKGDAEVVDTKL
jgi:hypothetical protein